MTAELGSADLATLDALRRTHFPPARNRLRAHLTLFHHLPPSVANELKTCLAAEARARPPRATIARIRNLGQGTAFGIESADLERIRSRLADRFRTLLTPQDAAGWHPHVTIQNKVSADEARSLQRALAADFQPRPLAITGLASWLYRDGDWEGFSRHAFRG